MKETWKCLPMLFSLLVASPAFAVDTSQTYNSGILVLAFLGFCAVVLMVQLFPALMILFGWVKSLFGGSAAAEKNRVKSH